MNPVVKKIFSPKVWLILIDFFDMVRTNQVGSSLDGHPRALSSKASSMR